MPTLLLKSAPPEDLAAAATRMGGPVFAPEEFVWPTCRTCDGPMLFFMQIRLADAGLERFADTDATLLLFQCTNDPGMCDDWSPTAGGNRAVVVEGERRQVEPPENDEPTLLADVHGVEPVPLEADAAYAGAYGQMDGGRVIGKLGGAPQWIQADESGDCVCGCGEPMAFVGQIEEAADEMNFGGGVGYAFACTACGREGAFLWQQ